MPQTAPTWSSHAVAFTRYRNWKEWTPVCVFLLESVPSSDTSIVGTCKQVEELDWPNSARWSDKKKIPPPPSLSEIGIWDHLPDWQKFAAWNGTLLLGIFTLVGCDTDRDAEDVNTPLTFRCDSWWLEHVLWFLPFHSGVLFLTWESTIVRKNS